MAKFFTCDGSESIFLLPKLKNKNLEKTGEITDNRMNTTGYFKINTRLVKKK